MKPYYEHAGITIYHGDCREVLPTLPRADLVLTDPPYGIGHDGSYGETTGSAGVRKAYPFLGWDQERPAAETLWLAIKAGRQAIVWGGNYFADVLPQGSRWLVWDKGQRISQSDGELAWTTLDGAALRICTLSRCELLMDGAQHPTQKPMKLMTWCLGFAPQARTVVDPFMGSGTTLRAAKDLGLSAIGIDIEERYCEIAARRLSQEVLFPAGAA